jgi:BirA family transcriptional regulator, biotin operon repressor / biotin---[acetyl-CoA-carboxylase] ligase
MFGSMIVHLDTVDSTNNYAARELLTKSLKEGTVFAAACQESGRGQGQASWESARGLNLTFSIVLYPRQIKIVRQFALSKAISLGVTDFLAQHVAEVAVKWPNDIYVADNKIAGILIETTVSSGEISRAVVGIGININQEEFFSDAPNPVSLKNLTGIPYDLPDILDSLCLSLDNRYHQLTGGKEAVIEADYEKQLYRRGKWANYRADDSDFEGLITGTDPDGRLQIQTRNGEIRRFQFKEVQFL